MNHADINFYFDPLCPFAWMTSKWVRQVTAQRDYTVDWRFISLRMLNGELRAETDEALALTGKDVGTPIIHFGPPRGTAFFGPVISRPPSDQEAIRLWDHVVGLASFPGFAELKRSLRERPQLRSFGVGPGETGIQEDWHGGSRRLKK